MRKLARLNDTSSDVSLQVSDFQARLSGRNPVWSMSLGYKNANSEFVSADADRAGQKTF
jgi:hypothetical protein